MQAGGKWRVYEDDVQGLGFTCCQPIDGVGLHDSDLAGIQLLQTFAEHSGRGPGIFDQCDVCGTARRGFQAQNAATGKQIDTRCAKDVSLQPVEQGFAAAVARGAQAGKVRHGQPRAAPLATYDSNGSRSFLFHIRPQN